MTLISNATKYLLLTFVFLGLFPVLATAQEGNSLTLSISPTLFEMATNPGQEWVSTLRVINANPYDLTIYANTVNFAPEGESGQGTFIPVSGGEVAGQSLAEWISFPETEYLIRPGQTLELPFTIRVPQNAPPGGHYAAVLIGTRKPDSEKGQMTVETSQVVTALVFLRVTGDVVEDGAIREFRTTERLTERPEMSFELRFQNNGNVHLLPQGEIRIFNMWGQERGLIPVNRQTLFGNVLPDSVRKYNFSWSGEWSFSDIGRYTAVATLAYGENGRQFADSTTSFWVLPWKIATIVLASILGFVYLVTWAIKLYIRKMLTLAGVSPDSPIHRQRLQTAVARKASKEILEADDSHILIKGRGKRLSLVAPFEEGMLDLRERLRNKTNWLERAKELAVFVQVYKVFFAVMVIVVAFTVAATLFVLSISKERAYEVTIDGLDQDVTLSSEQLRYESIKSRASTTTSVIQNFPPVKIINRSGIPGLAAVWRLQLEKIGYPIAELENELGSADEKTVIVYNAEYTDEALMLSGALYGALLSANLTPSKNAPIVIYIGSDLENAVE